MNLLIVIAGLMAFGYIATNIGASKKPGHEAMGMKPALYVGLAVLLGWIAWPVIGPIVMLIFHTFHTF